MSTMGERLRAAREARGLTIRALADQIGVQHPYIAKIEAGRHPVINTKNLIKLCRELGVSADWLACVWDDWKPGQEDRKDSEMSGTAV